MIRPKLILQPTDFSKDARYALDVACALAGNEGARVILLHVLPRAAPIGRDRNTPAYKEAHADEDLHAYREEMKRRLEELRRGAPFAHVQSMLKEGDAVSVVIDTAKEMGCDLIVITGTSPTLIGQAPCPVLVAHVPVPVTRRGTEAEMEATAEIC